MGAYATLKATVAATTAHLLCWYRDGSQTGDVPSGPRSGGPPFASPAIVLRGLVDGSILSEAPDERGDALASCDMLAASAL